MECDPEQEEEEEEEKGDEVEETEEEEKMAVEEEEEEDAAEVVEELQANGPQREQAEQDEDAAQVVAQEQSPALGTQGCLSRGGDAKSPVLQEKGKRKELALGEGRKVGTGVSRLGELLGPVGWSRDVRAQALRWE